MLAIVICNLFKVPKMKRKRPSGSDCTSDIWSGQFLEISIVTPFDLASALEEWKAVGKKWFFSLGIESVRKWVSCISAICVLVSCRECRSLDRFSGTLSPRMLMESSLRDCSCV